MQHVQRAIAGPFRAWGLGAVLLAGCGGGAASAGFAQGPMPQGAEWGGVYYSNWGRMELDQTGVHVTGGYEGDVKSGRIEGTASGNLLRFHWTQEDNTIPGHPRTVAGYGVFHYVVDQNNEHHLEGAWGYGEEYSGGGSWNASKSRARRRPHPNAPGTRPAGGTTGEGFSEGGEGEGEGGASPSGTPAGTGSTATTPAPTRTQPPPSGQPDLSGL